MRKVKKKRGQFKIQQMAFMLLAVILFFILVGLFWLAVQYRTLHKQATQLGESRAVLMSEFVSQSSEFSCGSKDGQYCVDTDKLMILKDRKVYSKFWPVSYIKVRRIYPTQEETECNKNNYPNCSVYNIYKNEKIESQGAVGSFVALCRYEKIQGHATRICELGKIIVGYEIK